ncbi:hypothetical protein CUMW_172140, partial [Citrus unshiu]
MGNVEEYVDNMMSVQNFCSMYAPGMMPLPEKHAWKWGSCNKLLPPMIDSLKTVSMKGSNETASCTALQCIESNSDSATNNLQSTHLNTVTHSAEEKDSLRMKSTSNDGRI